MKILVTGGAGRVGLPLVDELNRRGHSVTVCGRREAVEVPGAEYRSLDVTDASAVVRALEGFDTVIHLAAIPNPHMTDSATLFDINVRGTYHIFEAAEQLGMRHVVTASSINAVGMRYGLRPVPVRYFPIDEDHPPLLTDPYSYSKHLVESIGRYYWERAGISSLSIRIPAVLDHTAERAERLRRLRAEWDTNGPSERMLHMHRDFFVVVDARDSARAFAMAAEATVEGGHPAFVNDSRNCYGVPTRPLLRHVWPEVEEYREPLEADAAPITCRRARELFGWEPVHGLDEGAAV